MINTASLDTSLIVRVLVEDDRKKQQKVLDLLDSAEHFMLFDLALYETVYVMETIYEKEREEIVELIMFFLARYDEKISYNRKLISVAFPFYLSHPKLSFADCALAALAEIEGAEPLFTFDKKLASQHPSAKLLG